MLFANRLDLSVDESHRLNATCDILVNEVIFMFIDRTAPIHQVGKESGSALWVTDIQDYMTPEEMKEADLRALQVSCIL
jgi:hypothetical protein